MMKLYRIAVLLLGCSSAFADQLESPTLSVSIDPAFPRIIQYRLKETGAVLDAQPTPADQVELNGKKEACQISFRKTAADKGSYRLVFPQARIEIAMDLTVGADVVEWRVTGAKESGSTLLRSFALPGNALISLSSAQPDAAIATSYGEGYKKFRERLGPLASIEPVEETANYAFFSRKGIAAAIASNHIGDNQRIRYQIKKDGGETLIAASNPLWQYREIDTETLPLPWVKVLLTGDRNDDGVANWQDAAVLQRSIMEKPLGADQLRAAVGENIAMNFASGAQQPFLNILDKIKRAWLATDGLGQMVTIKGFSSEGHDSANTDYAGNWNERAGGLRDFNILLEQAGRYNAEVGIHINVTEVYPEAKRYLPEILKRDGRGNPVRGWQWLDSSHLIDKRKDLLSGHLQDSLGKMRAALPKLSYVYVDVYGENGWNAWKLGGLLNGMNFPIHTEYATVFDPRSIWSHARLNKSTVMRFLWYSDRQLFNDDAILRGGRGDDDGFMGWQNKHKFSDYIRSTFTRQLPAKYLKQFELLRWEPGVEAIFSEGVRVAQSGGIVTVTKKDQRIMTWNSKAGNPNLFIPWEGKVYLWHDAGGETDGPWPWPDRQEAFLYPLGESGRGAPIRITPVDGKVVTKLAPKTPYVLYPQPAPALPAIPWGEGSLVRDPGFESLSPAAWNPQGNARVESDANGNARLILTGTAAQTVDGLKPGGTYAATVWALATGETPVSFEVACGGKVRSNQTSRSKVPHRAPCDPRNGTFYQRLRVVFEVPAGETKAVLSLKAPAGGEFDDIRLVPTRRSPEAAKHWFWEDFENIESGGYGPFACCFDEYTHLSEANPPYTQDTINGRFSLKNNARGGLIARTVPSSLRFKPNTRYRLTCQTMGGGFFLVESGGYVISQIKFPGKPGQVSGEFATTGDTETFLSLYKEGGHFLVIDDLAIDELGHAAEPTIVNMPGEFPEGHKLLVEENLSKPLTSSWKAFASDHPGISSSRAENGLLIKAFANVSAGIERELPPGTSAVECLLDASEDSGETWGAGLCLLWKGGEALRVNVRVPEGRFGVDSTIEAQKRVGRLDRHSLTRLRLRIERETIIAEARNGRQEWQQLASFPRNSFPGDPVRVRVGKMHGVEGIGKHSNGGAPTKVALSDIRIYRKP